MRQIVLDTETTGLDPAQGHRIIEIGCVELENRRLTGNNYHVYINPEREIDQGAIEVHGITNEMLADKPLFGEVAAEFCDYIRDSQLVIHNAPFDVGFLDHELALLRKGKDRIRDLTIEVIDSLVMARKMHPGQRNSLDALCKRYDVDNSQRELHGALLDAEILADVYLAMTGGQTALMLGGDTEGVGQQQATAIKRLAADRKPLPVVRAAKAELEAHQASLAMLSESSGKVLDW